MAEMGLFFESVNGDRRYKVVELVAYLKPFFSDGVFPNPSNGLQVLESAQKDMFVTLKVGDAWINGRMYRNLDDKRMRIDPSDSATTRIDRIVVGCNYQTREITTYVKKGTPASVATAPALTRNDTIYELSLAEITIAPGAVGITQSAIRDTRLDPSICGIVTGLVNTVDTTTLYNQLETWRLEFMQQKDMQMANWIAGFQNDMNNWKTIEQNAFVEWFNSIKGRLSGDIAANLTTRVNSLEERLNTMKLTADNVSTTPIAGMGGGTVTISNVQQALEYLMSEHKKLKESHNALNLEVTGQASRLNGINNELAREIGTPTI